MALFVFIFLLASIISKKGIWKYLILITGVAFLTIQISSVIFGNSLLYYKYYAHINFLIFKSAGSFFVKENRFLLQSFLIISIISILFINLGLPKLNRMKNRKAYIAISDMAVTSELRKATKVKLSLPLEPIKTTRAKTTIIN